MIIEDLEINDNGERFHNFFNIHKLSVMNTWFSHKKCRRITWHSSDGNTKKVYDFILSCSWIRQYITNCRVYNSFDFDSDHRLVIAKLETPSTKTARFKNQPQKTSSIKYDSSALRDQTMTTNIKIEAINNLNSIDTETKNTVLYKNLLKSINEAAVNCLPIKEKSKLYQPWHNDEKLKHLYELKDRYI